jgi:hypothetical protein
MSYNLRKKRYPKLRAIEQALPYELLEMIYVLAITPPVLRYDLRPCPRVRTAEGPSRSSLYTTKPAPR